MWRWSGKESGREPICCSICTVVLLNESRGRRCGNFYEFAFEEYKVCTCMQQENAYSRNISWGEKEVCLSSAGPRQLAAKERTVREKITRAWSTLQEQVPIPSS